MSIHPSTSVYVAPADNRGRGVFAARDIPAGEIIEQCPVIVVCQSERPALNPAEPLHQYYFKWGAEQQGLAVALGCGSLYNHSYSPNAAYRRCLDEQLIEFYALREIHKEQEITVNYNGRAHDQSAVWFTVR